MTFMPLKSDRLVASAFYGATGAVAVGDRDRACSVTPARAASTFMATSTPFCEVAEYSHPARSRHRSGRAADITNRPPRASRARPRVVGFVSSFALFIIIYL